MELGESAEEAVIREAMEETGLAIHVEYLVGIYTKYLDEYPNGDQAQSVTAVFACTIVGGELRADNVETLDLQFFDPSDLPRLYNQQHQDALADFVANRRGIAR